MFRSTLLDLSPINPNIISCNLKSTISRCRWLLVCRRICTQACVCTCGCLYMQACARVCIGVRVLCIHDFVCAFRRARVCKCACVASWLYSCVHACKLRAWSSHIACLVLYSHTLRWTIDYSQVVAKVRFASGLKFGFACVTCVRACVRVCVCVCVCLSLCTMCILVWLVCVPASALRGCCVVCVCMCVWCLCACASFFCLAHSKWTLLSSRRQ
jgi:hypothetical protein